MIRYNGAFLITLYIQGDFFDCQLPPLLPPLENANFGQQLI